MVEIIFHDLITTEPPRQILEEDFPKLAPLPIEGGWGYDLATACIINRFDVSVDQGIPFDGVRWEYVFAQYRLLEELIVFRSPEEKYSGIEQELVAQKTVSGGGRRFDVLEFSVAAFREADFEALKREHEGPDGIQNPSFDLKAHLERRSALQCQGHRVYWFDITSFFGAGIQARPTHS